MLTPNFFFRFIRPVHLHLKMDKLNYLRSPTTDQIFFYNVLVLENILVQGPSPISLVRATRIFSKAKTLKKNFDLSLAIGDIPIYPF